MGLVTSTFTFTSDTETVTRTKLNNLVADLITEFNGSISSVNIAAGGIASSDLAAGAVDLTSAVVTGILPAANAAASVGTVGTSEIWTADSNKDTSGARNLTITGSYIIGSASMDETDLEKLDGITNGTVAADKALVVDSSTDLSNMGDLTFATSKGFILPSSAQGDIAYHNGTRYVRLAPGTSGNFLKTQGAAANPIWDSPGMGTLITSTTASAASTVDFTSFRDDALYRNYVVYGANITLSGAATTDILLRVSTDGGSSYDSGASDYNYGATAFGDSGATTTFVDSANDSIKLTESHDAAVPMGFIFRIYSPSTTQRIVIEYDSSFGGGSNTVQRATGVGRRNASQDLDAFRILPSTGTISGEFQLYGLIK